MLYKVIVKQIEIIEVNALNEEAAIKIVKDKLDPRSLVEIQVAEEIIVKDVNM